ncbi:MAG: hypothetical protein IKV32_01665 [Muribaculaceae bacterium]|nr:hypothetical protein [Muribaculaceae bacterium]
MKLQYKLGIMALGLIAFTSCEKNDPFANHLEIGERVPTVYWEVGSTAAKAGESFSFKGTYYTVDGATPAYSQVWWDVLRTDELDVTAKLAGSSFSYKKNGGAKDLLVRTNEHSEEFAHSLAKLDTVLVDRYYTYYDSVKGEWVVNQDSIVQGLQPLTQYSITGEVPVSETLTPVNWNSPKEWDDKKFEAYFPEGFADAFEKEVDSLIVTDGNYNALRYLYINYAFTNERFAEINAQFGTDFPTDIAYDAEDAQAGSTDKSTRWIDYNNPKVSGKAAPVVGYYYQTIEDGKTVYTEVAIDAVYEDKDGNMILAADTTTRTYEVYESASWVFSRYSDDLGSVVTTVRPEYIPAFKALVEPITFQEWIYSSSDGYAISFKRNYKLDASFRVYDTNGNVGKVSNTSKKQIEIN